MKIRIEDSFDAATALPGHDRCEGLHGHTYRVELVVAGEPKGGVLADFRDVKKRLREVLKDYDHQDLSLRFDYPSCETLCLEISKALKARLPGFEMLRIWEGEGKWVEMDASELQAADHA